ncbi:MAG TPA: HU family DNA-binding protein [Sumerlaeia bacterium]|nr:HU family DNA-binding protein [Sumerlaeia bacterium]
MTKVDVAARLADKVGLSNKQSVEALEVVLNCIKNALKARDKVSLVGFGTFYVKERNARNGRNPRTGKSITIPRKCVASFRPGKAFREHVRGLGPGPDEE